MSDSKVDAQHIDSPRNSHEEHLDAEFGGAENRQRLERKLLRKIDARMTILVVIYILNYVRILYRSLTLKRHLPMSSLRLIAIMLLPLGVVDSKQVIITL